MNTESLRYLLSALIQVFGALVAVDAIFLIFQHQYLVARRSPLLFELGRYVFMITRYHRVGENPDSLAHHREQELIEPEARRFETKNPSEITQEIVKAHDWMVKEIESLEHGLTHGHKEHWDENAARNNLEDLRRHRPQLEYFIAEYEKIRNKLVAMPAMVAKCMGVPGTLVVILCVALYPVGSLSEWQNGFLATVAIVLSALGLWFLIHQAYRVVKE